MKFWPALDVGGQPSDLVLATLVDFEPTAIEERESGMRVYFASGRERDAAADALGPRFAVCPIEVADGDWARRSQQNLAPVAVGRITVAPFPVSDRPSTPGPQPSPAGDLSSVLTAQRSVAGNSPSAITIIITPSMGFGTGHHATTRLCLEALQQIDLTGASVLDVGTGSGVLAIAAARLGAAHALGIDTDPDAIASARENLALNGSGGTMPNVSFEVADVTSGELPRADVVTANLTGALLVRATSALQGSLRGGGTLVVSGLLAEERRAVIGAFGRLEPTWEKAEDGWVGLAFREPDMTT